MTEISVWDKCSYIFFFSVLVFKLCKDKEFGLLCSFRYPQHPEERLVQHR